MTRRADKLSTRYAGDSSISIRRAENVPLILLRLRIMATPFDSAERGGLAKRQAIGYLTCRSIGQNDQPTEATASPARWLLHLAAWRISDASSMRCRASTT